MKRNLALINYAILIFVMIGGGLSWLTIQTQRNVNQEQEFETLVMISPVPAHNEDSCDHGSQENHARALCDVIDVTNMTIKFLGDMHVTGEDDKIRRSARSVDSEKFQNTPLTANEAQCMLLPLRTIATRAFYINSVNITYIDAEEVRMTVEYESPTDEVIVGKPKVLAESIPTPKFCNELWKSFLPNFFVQSNTKVLEKLLPQSVWESGKRGLPLTCIQAVGGLRKHIVGSTLMCPRVTYIEGDILVPATNHLRWLCWEEVLTYLPTHWKGRCSPYWSAREDKTDSGLTQIEVIEEKYDPGLAKVEDIEGKLDTESETEGELETAAMVQGNEQDMVVGKLDFWGKEMQHITSNLWYQYITRKVRKVTSNSCYACAVMSQSTNQLFNNVAVLLKGHDGIPARCMMMLQFVLQTHPVLGLGVGQRASRQSTVIAVRRLLFHEGARTMIPNGKDGVWQGKVYTVYSHITGRTGKK